MSNLAAAATLGSNHNSRANDGEILAKRGFWPGLAVSLKHSSIFASFIIIAKGEYPSEMNIPLPFSLINNNVHKNRLEILPAFFWMFNLYALERNSWKTKNRDKRKVIIQRIESDYLAPDTTEEIINAILLLEKLTADTGLKPEDKPPVREISCHEFEHSKREQVIIKPFEAIAAYRQMLRYYAIKTVTNYLDKHPELDYHSLNELLGANMSSLPQNRIKNWVNIGGQIVPAFRVDELRKEIGEGKYKTWDEIHNIYDLWDKEYQFDKCCHAWAVLALLQETDSAVDITVFRKELAAVLEIRDWIEAHIIESRKKDYINPFKKATFRNTTEMEQVLGKVSENPFILIIQKESAEFKEMIKRVDTRLAG
jgi:hypothetical protein